MSEFQKNGPALSDAIINLVNTYRELYPELVVVDVHVTYDNHGGQHNWVSHKFTDFDVTGKQTP